MLSERLKFTCGYHVKSWAKKMASAAEGNKIMVFRPTLSEFSNFPAYIRKMEEMGAHRAGVAKVNFGEKVLKLSLFLASNLFTLRLFARGEKFLNGVSI